MQSDPGHNQLQNPCVPFEPPLELKHPLTNKLLFIKKNVISTVLKHHDSWPFRKPVDVVGLKLLDYHRIIKNPMDLNTIYKRLSHGWYKEASECVDDFNLIIQNCLTYNKPNEDVSRMAEVLRRYFYEKMLKIPHEEYVLVPGKRKESGMSGDGNATSESKSPGSSRKTNKRVKGQGTIQKKCFDVIYELFDNKYADFMSQFYRWPESSMETEVGVSSSNLSEVKHAVENMRYQSFIEFVNDVSNILERVGANPSPDLSPKVAKFKCLFDEILINVGIQHTNEETLERTFDALLERVVKLEQELEDLKKTGGLSDSPQMVTPQSNKTATPSTPTVPRRVSSKQSVQSSSEHSDFHRPVCPPVQHRTLSPDDIEEDVYTYDEKRKLSSIVTTRLPTDELIRIIQMVKDKEPNTGKLSETGEFVFDFQQLKTSTIRLIEQQTNDYLRKAEKNLTSGGNKRKYSDKFNPETIVERKLELERELDDVKNILAPNPKKSRNESSSSVGQVRAPEYHQPMERLSDESDDSSIYLSDSDGMDLG